MSTFGPGGLHGRLSLLLLVLEILLTLHHHTHLGLVTQVPHPPLIVQQSGFHQHRVEARCRQHEEELRLKVLLLHWLCPFQVLQLWRL